MSIELIVNGERRTVTAGPDELLRHVLREELSRTGRKYGCGDGRCGFCTPGTILAGAALLTANPHPAAATSPSIRAPEPRYSRKR